MMITPPQVSIDTEGPIVMVDDNDGDLLIARKCFERSRLRNPWISLPSGAALLKHLEDVRAGEATMPALVLLDINMPRMTGPEVLERVRTIPYFSDLPVFCMLTSSTDPADRARVERLGASGFVVKPNQPDDYVEFFDALAE